MKKLFLLSCLSLPLFLSACGVSYVHSTEPRSVVYMGQPAGDVYENFGKPTKIQKLNYNEQILIYEKQEIEKDWAYRYFHHCIIKFHMVDDRVANWFSTGDICAIKSHASTDFSTNLINNALLPFGIGNDAFEDTPLYNEIPASQRSRTPFIPADTFTDSANVFHEEMPFSNTEAEEEFGIFDAPKSVNTSTTYDAYYNIPADAF